MRRSQPIDTLETEESLVLEGTGELGGFAFGPGDYHRARSGSLHPSYASKEGACFCCFPERSTSFIQRVWSKVALGTSSRCAQGLGRGNRSALGWTFRLSFLDSESGVEATILQRLGAGSSLTASEFSVSEAFILEGKARLGSMELSAGDYLQKIQSEPEERTA